MAVEDFRDKLRAMRKDEGLNYLFTGPYIGILSGLTFGAMDCIQRSMQGKEAARRIARGGLIFGGAGIAYGITGYMLTQHFARKDEADWQAVKARWWSGVAAGLTAGALGRSQRLALVSAIALGIASAADLISSKWAHGIDVFGWDLKPHAPPITLGLKPN